MNTAYLDKEDLQIKMNGFVFSSWKEAEEYFFKSYTGVKDDFESAFDRWAENNRIIVQE